MKTTKEMIDVMQAFERGEQIQAMALEGDIYGWDDTKEPWWDWYHLDYRVKPKKKYVPFDTAEEFLREQEKRNTDIIMFQGKTCRAYTNYLETLLFEEFSSTRLCNLSYQRLFFECKFEDGTPCGKEVEE